MLYLDHWSGAAADEAVWVVEPETVLALGALLREEVVAEVQRELAALHRLTPVGQTLVLLQRKMDSIQLRHRLRDWGEINKSRDDNFLMSALLIIPGA